MDGKSVLPLSVCLLTRFSESRSINELLLLVLPLVGDDDFTPVGDERVATTADHLSDCVQVLAHLQINSS